MAIDIAYKIKGAHYRQYTDEKKLMQDSNDVFDAYLEDLDQKIVDKIH